MINIKGIALLSAAALLAPAVVSAAETLPWTFIQGGYTRADGGEETLETDAYSALGSVGFLGNWHAQLEYTDGEVDARDFDRDFDGYRLIAGAHPQITDNTQLRIDITYFDYSVDGGEGFSDVDTDGYGVGFGLRHAFSPKLEATVQAWYLEGDRDNLDLDADDIVPGLGCESSECDFQETVVEIQGRYNWTQNLSTGLTIALGGGVAASVPLLSGDSATFDVRWSFGNNDFSDL
jgi:hypothetical protein